MSNSFKNLKKFRNKVITFKKNLVSRKISIFRGKQQSMNIENLILFLTKIRFVAVNFSLTLTQIIEQNRIIAAKVHSLESKTLDGIAFHPQTPIYFSEYIDNLKNHC